MEKPTNISWIWTLSLVGMITMLILLMIFGIIWVPPKEQEEIFTVPQFGSTPTHQAPGIATSLPTPQGGSKRDITGHADASGGTPSASSGPSCSD